MERVQEKETLGFKKLKNFAVVSMIAFPLLSFSNSFAQISENDFDRGLIRFNQEITTREYFGFPFSFGWAPKVRNFQKVRIGQAVFSEGERIRFNDQILPIGAELCILNIFDFKSERSSKKQLKIQAKQFFEAASLVSLLDGGQALRAYGPDKTAISLYCGKKLGPGSFANLKLTEDVIRRAFAEKLSHNIEEIKGQVERTSVGEMDFEPDLAGGLFGLDYLPNHLGPKVFRP